MNGCMNIKKPLRRNPPLKQLEVIVRLHIIPYFGNKRIMRIRRAEVKRWLQQYTDMKDEQGREKYSFGSRLKYLSVLKSIFHDAVHELEVLEKNPFGSVKGPRPRHRRYKERDKIL